VYTSVECNDGNLCTTDSCHPVLGCVFTAMPSPNPHPCVDGECDPDTGIWTFFPKCVDHDACTMDICDPLTGNCYNPPMIGICEELLSCATHQCNPITGQCDYDFTNCQICNAREECGPTGELQPECQTVECIDLMEHGKFCEVGPKVCIDEEDPCLVGTCVEGSGCVDYKPVECPASTIPCMEYTCDRKGGCILVPIACDNGDPCSTGTCNPLTGLCEFEPKVCSDPGELCQVATCVPDYGCVQTPKVCDDYNPCTIDTCFPLTGDCHFEFDPDLGCEPCHTDEDCDDDLVCTSDFCHPDLKVCIRTPHCLTPPGSCETFTCEEVTEGEPGSPEYNCVPNTDPCDDGLGCTVDLCIEDYGCVHLPLECPDSENPCVTLQCREPLANETDPYVCESVAVDCDDGNPCTDDTCSTGVGCQHTPVECEPTELNCEANVCNPATGECEIGPLDCDDFDDCTTDLCDEETGCYNVLDPAVCPSCNDDSDCTPPEPCLINARCEEGPNGGMKRCVFDINTCDDFISCTIDTCNPQTGECSHEPDCPSDGDLCTVDSCSPISRSCIYVPVHCDDSNPCTSDQCNPDTGLCEHDWIPSCCLTDEDCVTTDRCSVGNCNGNICSFTEKQCNDINPCTNDSCNPVNGECVHEWIPNCCSTDADCDDDNPCSNEMCDMVNMQCVYSSKNCYDNNPCTQDTCDPETGDCVHTPINNCCQTSGECDDQDPCTVDTCEANRCVFTPIPDCK